MKCAVHGDREAAGYCRNCGKAMCSECAHPVHQVLYCEDCLSAAMGQVQPPLEAHPGVAAQPSAQAAAGVSPGLALFLGFIPGLGAVYNGEYNKALFHVLVFGTLVLGASSDVPEPLRVLLILGAIGFGFFMAIDSMRTAQARRAGASSSVLLEARGKERPVGAILLIVLGALFLLSNLGWFPWDRLSQFWPVILIVVGILMLRNRMWRSS